MAKHFKQEPTQSTAVMRRQQDSAPAKNSVRAGETEGFMPYGQAATYRGSFADAAPTGEYFMDDAPARGGFPAFLRGVLLAFAWILRFAAFVMVAIVLLNVLSISPIRTTLTKITDTITAVLPWQNIGLLEVDTPFGGVFRGDLAIVALVLFVIDWILCRIRAALR